MLRELVIGLLGVVALAYAIEFVLIHFDDPREPRRVSTPIPLVGHLIGLTRYSSTYYTRMSKQTDEDIYTLGIFNFKLYIANSPRIFSLAQKTKTLSFRPIIQMAARSFGDATDEVHALFGGDLVDEFAVAMRDSLMPGPHLDAQNARMGKRALLDIAELHDAGEIDLLAWTRHAVLQATSCGLYGEQHPFVDPEAEAACLLWESYLPAHIMGGDLLRKGYAARDKVFEAFRKYCANVPDDAARFITERQRVLSEHGIGGADLYKQEATLISAAFPNTIPTLYWTIHELFARPELLEEVQREIASNAVTRTDDGFSLDVAALKVKCPLLLSVMQETQRTRHVHAGIRRVMEDTIIDGRYLLKKGNMLMMPGQPVHANSKLWGADVDTFDPYRFIRKDEKKIAPSSFVPWGSAPHLCPARQFASTEIFIMVALLIMRFDLVPVKRQWELKPELDPGAFVTLLSPKKDLRVSVRAKEEAKGAWVLDMGESKTRVSLASG